MNTTHKFESIFLILITLFLSSCVPQQEETVSVTPAKNQPEISLTVDAEFTLKTIAEEGRLLYIGIGGEIDGIINPDLVVQPDAMVRLFLINGDGMVHDLFLPDFDLKTDYVRRIGDQTEILFETDNMQPGSYVYYCTLPGHRKAGQEGNLIVGSSE